MTKTYEGNVFRDFSCVFYQHMYIVQNVKLKNKSEKNMLVTLASRLIL